MTSSNIVAIVFDFDDTLAPDSTSSFLQSLDVAVRDFWKEAARRVREGWDPVPAYLQMMIEESKRRAPAKRITREKLRQWGRRVELHAGVPQIFGRIRKQVSELNPEVKVEYYMLSSGIGDVLRATGIAKHFSDIWACEFNYNRKGEIDALKNIISFTDKTRFIFQISKGIIGPAARRDPFAVNRKVAGAELRVPLNQMIIVGDGYTDIPCFSLAQKSGGIAIGVYSRESRDKWGKAWGFLEDQRVKHLVAADFKKHSGLDDALSLAVDKIVHEITLRSRTYQG